MRLRNLLKYLIPLVLLLPLTAQATTTIPWSITNLTDGFIFPNLVNGSAKGVLVSASSTVNGNLSVSTLTSGDCVQASTGGLLVSTSGACGSGSGSSFAYPFPNNATSTQLNFSGGLQVGSGNGFLGSNGGVLYNFASSSITTLSGLSLPYSQLTGVPTFDTFGYPFPNNATTSALTLGGLTLSNLAGGGTLCVHVNNSGTLSTTASDCGSGSGGVTGVTGSYPIVSSGGTAPNITFSGLATTSPWTQGQLAYVVNGNTVASAATTTLTAGGVLNLSNPVTILGSVSSALTIPQSGTGASGYLSATDWNTFNGKQAAGNYITALTGDGSAAGPGSSALTLATVNTNVGTFTYPSVTVNGKGLITAISNGSAPTTYTGTAPIFVSGSTIGTSFSTSTFNAFTAENTFTNLFATNASSTFATTTNLAITGGASNCGGTNALTTNSSGVVGCTAQAQGTVTAVSVASSNGFAGSSSGGATPALTLSTTITGLLKGNGTAISAAANGTDFTLLTANTCGAGQFFNSATAAGILGCGTPAGTTYTGTFPIAVTGSVISSGYSTTTNTGLAQGIRYIGSGGIDQIAASSSIFGFTPQAAGNYLTALTGDGTASGPGSSALTLATVNSNIGTFNNITINAKGLATAGSNVAYDTFGYPFPSNATTSSLTFGGVTVTGAATGCATFTTGVLSSTGTACGSGSGSAFPFTPQTYGNSTTSVIAFLGGLVSNGSTTISSLGTGFVQSSNGLLSSAALTSSNITTALGFTPLSTAVTNVGLSLPTGFTVTNSPVTTTGTLTATLNSGFSVKEVPSWTVCSSGCDFTTIQAGLNAAGTAGGGTIYLTDAVYNDGATGLLIKSSNTTITSNASTTINFTGATTLFKTNAAASQFSNITISNLIITGDNTTGGVAINMSDMTHSHYTNNTISTVDTCFVANDTQNITFYNRIADNNCTFKSFGLNASSTNAWNANIVDGNFFGGQTAGAIGIQMTNANGDAITNNRIETASVNTTKDIYLFDNNIATCNGIFNNTFSGNYLESGKATNSTTGIIFGASLCASTKIYNNEFSNNIVENHQFDYLFNATSTQVGLQNWQGNIDSNFGNPLTSFEGPVGIGTSSELAAIGFTTQPAFSISAINANTYAEFVVANSSNRTDLTVNNTGSLQLGTTTAGCLNTSSTGIVYAATCAAGGGASYPFTPGTFGATLTSATSTAINDSAGLIASSTSFFQNINATVNSGAVTAGAFTVNSGGVPFALTASDATNFANTTSLVKFSQLNASDSGAALEISNAGTGNSIVVDQGTSTFNGSFVQKVTSGTAHEIFDAFGTLDELFNTASTTGSIFTVAATTSPSLTSPIKLFDVDQYGHLTASSTPATPTISSCGSGSPAMGTNANDDTGTFVTGTSASACTITFGRAYATTPVVVISDSNTTAVADISAVSTTAFTVSLASALSAVTVYYIVVQP